MFFPFVYEFPPTNNRSSSFFCSTITRKKTLQFVALLFRNSLPKQGNTIVYIAFLLICLISSLSAYCQLNGKVQDTAQQPLPFANVLLFSAEDSIIVKGVITSESGQFITPTPASGNYLLSISILGYQSHYAAIEVSSAETCNLGTYVLKQTTQELGEVTVRETKPMFEQQSDRLVVHVQNSISSAGATALDILERSPGVVINKQSGVVALNGKEGVGILINGKYSRIPASTLIEMLRGINSSTIEIIELISNPPARYDAEGTGGLINIVLEKNTNDGTSGSASLTHD
jgi:hypothetical protein